MTIWKPAGVPRKGRIYLALADALEQDVAAGVLAPGTRLPTHRELARRLGINVVTVTRAYAEAARRGLVEGEVGRGTFVTGAAGAAGRRGGASLPLASAGATASGRGDARPPVDFAFNLPAADETQPTAAHVARTLARVDVASLLHSGYQPAGLPRHRATGARFLAALGLDAPAERVLVTGGAQHGLAVVLSRLLDPGDVLLTEEVTYPGALALAGVLHLRLHGVAMDAEGLRPDALDRTAAAGGGGRARVLYVMPTIQNPTGRIQSATRRAEIAEVARRRDLLVIEDDSYGFLAEQAPAPLAAALPERTFFATSLSKCLASGLRVGFLLVPSGGGAPEGGWAEALSAQVAALTWAASPLTAELAACLVDDGSLERSIAAHRRETKARRELFAQLLPDHASDSPLPSPHVWLALPPGRKAADTAAEAARRGVLVSSPEAFTAGREAPRALRVCVGTPADRQDVRRGLEVLASVLAGEREGGAHRRLV